MRCEACARCGGREARASLCCLSSTDVCQALLATPSPRIEPEQLAAERRQLCRLRRPHILSRARVWHFQRRPVVAAARQPLPPHHDTTQTLFLVGRRRVSGDVRRLTTCSRQTFRPREYNRGEGVRTLGADGVAGARSSVGWPVPELSGPHGDRLTDPRLLARVQRVAVPAHPTAALLESFVRGSREAKQACREAPAVPRRSQVLVCPRHSPQGEQVCRETHGR